MPNDNTHTLLPCPFCGRKPYKHLAKKRNDQNGDPIQHHVIECQCRLARIEDWEDEAIAAWNTRTPAEPKAQRQDALMDQMNDLLKIAVREGMYDAHQFIVDHIDAKTAEPKAVDWEKEPIMWCGREVEFDDFGVSFRHHSTFATPVTYSTICKIADRYRALSSAAPRITEEMVERVHAEVLTECNKGGRPFFDAPREIKDRLIALLRQQGPPPFTPTQTEE